MSFGEVNCGILSISTTKRWSRGTDKKTSLVLLVFLLMFLIAASGRTASARRSRQRDAVRKTTSTTVEPTQSDMSNSPEADLHLSGSKEKNTRRSEKKNRRHGPNVLKTSQRAKILTEKRYLKKDWCKSRPVKQYIRTKSGCKAVLINQFCYGHCNSFYIPKDLEVHEADEELTPQYFKSCAFCKPKSEEWITVRLKCKRAGRKRKRRFIKKRVKRVKGCRCIAVPGLERTQLASPVRESDFNVAPTQMVMNSTSNSSDR